MESSSRPHGEAPPGVSRPEVVRRSPRCAALVGALCALVSACGRGDALPVVELTTTFYDVVMDPGSSFRTDHHRISWEVQHPADHVELVWIDPRPIDVNYSAYAVPATCDPGSWSARRCLLALRRDDMDTLIARCGVACRVEARRPVDADGVPVEVSAVVAGNPFLD